MAIQEKNGIHTTALAGVLGAYVWWGISPLFFKLLTGIDALEIIAHRVVWSLAMMGIIKAFGYRRGVIRSRFARPLSLLPTVPAAALILFNWLLFVWAVNHDHVLDTSLGYFINPLFSVLLGIVILGERLRPWQTAAVLLATAGVVQLVVREGHLPWVALLLAITWGFYGLVRKKAPIDAINGLTLELMISLPFAVAFLAWRQSQGLLQFGADPVESFWLVLAGPITMVPLMLFGYAAPRMGLITLGILQYVSPSISFALAVFFFEEPFGGAKLLAFVLIWIALAVYTVDLLLGRRQRADAVAEPVPVD
jgi:chloramphenicol-sensitive protein RarD